MADERPVFPGNATLQRVSRRLKQVCEKDNAPEGAPESNGVLMSSGQSGDVVSTAGVVADERPVFPGNSTIGRVNSSLKEACEKEDAADVLPTSPLFQRNAKMKLVNSWLEQACKGGDADEGTPASPICHGIERANHRLQQACGVPEGAPASNETVMLSGQSRKVVSADLVEGSSSAKSDTLRAKRSKCAANTGKASGWAGAGHAAYGGAVASAYQYPQKVLQPPMSNEIGVGEEGYSPKVFISDLPIDMTEECIKSSLYLFGEVAVDWPDKNGNSVPPKQFTYLYFQNSRSVELLTKACDNQNGELHFRMSSPTVWNHPVRIKPYKLSDTYYTAIPPSCFRGLTLFSVFIGHLHREIDAAFLAEVMNREFGQVAFVAIILDKLWSYPKGCGMVFFSNYNCFEKAVTQKSLLFYGPQNRPMTIVIRHLEYDRIPKAIGNVLGGLGIWY